MKWSYSITPDKLPDGTGRLRFRVSLGCNRVAFNIGIRVELDKWNNEAQRSKPNVTHGRKKIPANYINREIQKYIDTAERLMMQYDVPPSVSKFRKDFNDALQRTPESGDSIIQVLDRFVADQSVLNQWSDATIFRFRALRNKLEPINTPISEVDTEWLTKFVNRLSYTEKLANSTVFDYLKRMNWFLKWAEEQGESIGTSYKRFSPRLQMVKRPVIFLTWEELMTVYTAELPADYLIKARDLFCFCCFTSLRYSDLANLKSTDVYDDHIKIVTKKTSDYLIIDLNDYSRAILKKYDNELPRMSNQKMNQYIKEIGMICGIDEPVTIVSYVAGRRVEKTQPKWRLLGTHAGRRTFISNALGMGIPRDVVMKWTGHKDFKSMDPYTEIENEVKKSMMNRFNSPLLSHDK